MPTDIATLIREERKNANLTLSEVSERTGISASFFSVLERGKQKPTLQMIQKIAKGLNLPEAQLMELAVHLKPEEPVLETPEELQSHEQIMDSKKEKLVSFHPLELLLALDVKSLKEVFLSHMQTLPFLYHDDFLRVLIKRDEKEKTSQSIVDLMIVHHRDIFHINIFKLAVIHYLEPDKKKRKKLKLTPKEVETFTFFPFWRTSYFTNDILSDYRI